MSTDYDAGLAVGWLLTIEDLKSVFGRSIPEESHMEDRWDPKTGVGPTQIRIVDREQGWYLQLPNDEELFNQGFDPASSEGDVLGFLEKLCTQARCEFAYPNLENDSFVIGCLFKDQGEAPPMEVRATLKRAVPIGRRLKKLGLSLKDEDLKLHALLYIS
jgi:hypothetical protein